MHAVIVTPGQAGSDRFEDVPDPRPTGGEVVVEVLAVGVDGTDDEIARGEYGEAPPGDDYLIIGEEHGWSDRAGAFIQSFGSDDLDASNLMLPIVGFLPATEARMRATIDAIADRLTDKHGFVYRYRTSDGLEGGEGTFAICTFWLVHCLAMAGETGRARELFERLTGFANDVGLMSEELDPDTGLLLGNFPQAFTHIGLVNAAWAIAQAEAAPRPPR